MGKRWFAWAQVIVPLFPVVLAAYITVGFIRKEQAAAPRKRRELEEARAYFHPDRIVIRLADQREPSKPPSEESSASSN